MTTNNTHRPESYPPVPPDFQGPVLIELEPSERNGRGRFYRPEGQGYTDDLFRAGVWAGQAGIERARSGTGRYAVSAEAALTIEQGRFNRFCAAVVAAQPPKVEHALCPHEKAMAVTDQALALLRHAANLEEGAAKAAPEGTQSRAILARSAAWLWLQGDKPASARRVALWGLETAPGFIDGELRDVIEAVKNGKEAQ